MSTVQYALKRTPIYGCLANAAASGREPQEVYYNLVVICTKLRAQLFGPKACRLSGDSNGSDSPSTTLFPLGGERQLNHEICKTTFDSGKETRWLVRYLVQVNRYLIVRTFVEDFCSFSFSYLSPSHPFLVDISFRFLEIASHTRTHDWRKKHSDG